MFSLDVIKALSVKDLKSLDLIIKNHKRNSIKKLYAILKRNRNSVTTPTKEKLFKASFSTDYTKDKDYLLRKEFQILRELLKDFLVHQQAVKEYETHQEKRNLLYHKALYELSLPKWFDKTITKSIESSKNCVLPSLHSELIHLHYLSKKNQKTVSLEQLNDCKLTLENWIRALEVDFLNQIRTIEVHQSYTNLGIARFHALDVHHLEHLSYYNLLDLSSIEHKSELNTLMKLRTSVYYKLGKERIEVLKKITELINKVKITGLDLKAYQKNAYLHMAVEYSKLGNFTASIEFHEKALEDDLNDLDKINFHSLFFYVNSLIYGKEHKKALNLMTLYQEHAISEANLNYLIICKSYNYLFLNNTNQALLTLKNLSKNSIEYLKILERLIYIMYIRKSS